MAKRRSGGCDDGGRTAKRRRKQHLYLLVDDWAWGYSVRKIDLPIAADSDPGQVARLPPAVFRFEARPHQLKMAAVGTRIIHWPGPRCPLSLSQVTAFDVRSRSLAVVPPQPEFHGGPVLIPVGDRLFVLSAYSFQVLNDLQSASPFWEDQLPMPPIEADHYFAASAVHPDGRTIFVSVKSTRGTGGFDTSAPATYSFDTAAAPRPAGWTKHGDWALPFTDRAHFDADLDAWIGLAGNRDSIRHICACDVVPAANDAESEDGSGGRPCPSAKMMSNTEASFSDSCLVPMGGRSEFCIVHHVDDDAGGSSSFYPRPISERCKFRLVTFSLEYDKNGDLTTGNTRRVRHYRCPDAGGYSLLSPAAFWL